MLSIVLVSIGSLGVLAFADSIRQTWRHPSLADQAAALGRKHGGRP